MQSCELGKRKKGRKSHKSDLRIEAGEEDWNVTGDDGLVVWWWNGRHGGFTDNVIVD